MMCSNVDNYMLVAKMGLVNLKTVIQLLKAVNFKEVFTICFPSFFFYFVATREEHLCII